MPIRRFLGLAFAGWTAGMVVGAAAALAVKRQLVPTTDEAADDIVAVAIFGPLAFHSTSSNFRGGRLECWYGGGVLDLRDATLAPEGATLQVRAIFGGGQILVPSGWKVVSTLRGMGGLQDLRGAKGYAADAPELAIEGLLIAGGFAVMSQLDDDGAEWFARMEAKRDDGLDVGSDPTTATIATNEMAAETTTEMAPAMGPG
jgi:hypothetical protein